MKTQRILGILWLALCGLMVIIWPWKFRFIFSASLFSYPAASLFQAFATILLSSFGAVASFHLCRGARWARIAIGILALVVGSFLIWNSWEAGWKWPADYCAGIFALASAVILLFPRRHAVV